MNNNGYDNSKIGYNQDSGYVTYDNQPFMKPQMNVNGTTYTDQSTFDNALNQYKQNSANTAAAYNTTPQPAAQPANQGYTNPYTQQITDIMSRINAASQSQPVDVYSTPQYAAAQAQAQRGANESIRAGQEMFGNDRMARSSDALQFGQNAQNKANEYLNLQLVPQIQAQLQAQKQQELQNQQAQFNNYFNLSNQADSQYNSDRNFNAGRQDAATAATAYYTPDANTISSVRKQMEANSAAYADASPEQQKQLHEANLQLAASIGGNDTTGNGDYAYGPMRTIQGQQLDYNQQKDQRDFQYQTVQDAIKNGMSQQQIDNQAQQFAQRLGFDYDNMNANDKQAWAQIAISQQNADTSSASQKNSSDRLDWEKDQANNKSKTASDYYKELDSSMYINPETITDQYGKTSNTGKTVVSDPDGLENYIFSLDLAPEETYKLLNRYKLVKK